MKPNEKFLNLPKTFWANVRLISQEVGYTAKGTDQIRIPSVEEMKFELDKLEIDFDRLRKQKVGSQNLDVLLQEYFTYRADVLNTYVEPRLMDVRKAKQVFRDYRSRLKPSCPIPMNKQKGTKKAPAYLTGLVNMLVEANSKGLPCDYDPHQLTILTRDDLPLRTLARRVDSAFPSSVNPIAIWEIKE